MAELPFDWKLQRTNNYHQKRNCFISSLKLNAEWSLVCLWSQYEPCKPELLEIRRNSTSQKIEVSGTLELQRHSVNILRRKFTQWIEAGCTTMLVDLEHLNNVSHHVPYYYEIVGYSIIGTLKIDAAVTRKKYAKGVQFESLLNLSSDFECLLDPKATYFSDVNLKCGALSFQVHKNILSARSPVFAAMFTNQMKETRDNKVDIVDVGPQPLKTMLTYLYTGKTGDLSAQSAGELLFAADKYQLKDLKRVCSEYLKNCVSSQNVLNTLVLGYLHDQDLKVFAMDFICNTAEEFEVLEKTAEWKTLREKRPNLAMDVLTHLVKSKDKKLKGRNK